MSAVHSSCELVHDGYDSDGTDSDVPNLSDRSSTSDSDGEQVGSSKDMNSSHSRMAWFVVRLN